MSGAGERIPPPAATKYRFIVDGYGKQWTWTVEESWSDSSWVTVRWGWFQIAGGKARSEYRAEMAARHWLADRQSSDSVSRRKDITRRIVSV